LKNGREFKVIVSKEYFEHMKEAFMPKEKAEKPKKLRPLYDKIVVERIKEKDISDGGIIIPDQAKEKPRQGLVLAVGEGAVTLDGSIRPMRVKVGEIVLFGKYAGTDTEIGSTEFLLLREDDVLGVIE
jgi:chaperonin GroES